MQCEIVISQREDVSGRPSDACLGRRDRGTRQLRARAFGTRAWQRLGPAHPLTAWLSGGGKQLLVRGIGEGWCLPNSNASWQPPPATRSRLYRPQLQLHDSALQASKFCMERNAECCLSGWKWREEVENVVDAAERTMRRAGETVSARVGSQGTRGGSGGKQNPGRRYGRGRGRRWVCPTQKCG